MVKTVLLELLYFALNVVKRSIVRVRMTMTTPFEYVGTILDTKVNMMRGTENDQLAENGYNPWLTNMALSQHEDTLLIANLVNQNHHLPKRAQYELLINIVRPKKRQFKKWAKNTVDEDLNLVCAIYECNRNVGKDYLSLLLPEQLELLRKQQQQGGTKG